jgi:UDP:flavonoid glycosyltransferase YjiC (YdhE family)
MPYSHDQPDNAARCRRSGVALVIGREEYNSVSASAALNKLLTDHTYRSAAERSQEIVYSEKGSESACDEIERLLSNQAVRPAGC